MGGKTRFYLAHASNFAAGFGTYDNTIGVTKVENEWVEVNYKNSGLFNIEDKSFVLTPLNFIPLYEFLLFRISFLKNTPSDPSKPIRVYVFELTEGEQVVCKMVPAIDKATGTIGMFDLVNRVFKSNKGTGDFTYPTDAPPAVTADFDEKFYAKLTEHGVRRLYHVPHGYTGSKDQYAVDNGYKELVEPPMPL